MKIGGGHFAPKLGGHFELESGGHFKLELGGQYHWNLQCFDQIVNFDYADFLMINYMLHLIFVYLLCFLHAQVTLKSRAFYKPFTRKDKN
jgi:hypothetical protein